MIPTPAAIPSQKLIREISPLTPFHIQKPPSPFSKSNIALSAEKSLPPSTDRPALLPLAKLKLIYLVGALEQTQQALVEALSQRLSTITNESNAQSREYQNKLKENGDKVESSLLWSMLKKVWSAFFSAVTTLFGGSNIMAGNVLVGAALITSGILSLTNLFCSEMGIWDEVAKKLAEDDKERQKQIAFCIPLALSILSVGFALFGGVYDLTHSKEFFSNHFGFALTASLSIFNGIVEIGQGMTQSRLLYSQADLLKIQTALESSNIHTKMCSDALGSFFASTQQIFESLSQVMQMEAQANLSILQV